MFLLVKAVKTSRSILLLLNHSRFEDSFVLLRTLAETFIVYKWIKKEGNRAVIRFARQEAISKIKNHNRSRTKTIYKRDSDFDYLSKQTEDEEQLKGQNKLLKEYEPEFDLEKQKEMDKVDRWAGISLREMSESLSKDSAGNLNWLYHIPFTMCSQYVHPDPVTVWNYIHENGNEVKPELEKTDDGLEVFLLSVNILLSFFYEANNDFALSSDETVTQLRQRFDEICKETDSQE